eukprot:8175030-Alexandrium_andersonii.AAC.1
MASNIGLVQNVWRKPVQNWHYHEGDCELNGHVCAQLNLHQEICSKVFLGWASSMDNKSAQVGYSGKRWTRSCACTDAAEQVRAGPVDLDSGGIAKQELKNAEFHCIG